jgi:hypothetical protein
MIVVNVGPTDATSLLHRLYLLPYGRASALFVVIAGIGMGFLLGRGSGRPPGRRDGAWPVVLWRAGLLVAGGMALPLDLGAEAARAVAAARPAAERAGVALVTTPPSVPAPAVADPARLAQVLGNLLDNAVRHTPAGGAVTVAVSRDAGGEAVVTVTDTG